MEKIAINKNIIRYKELLNNAELQYKYALTLHLTLPQLSYLDEFAYGSHKAKKRELKLNKKEEAFAVSLIEHCSIYIMAAQMDTVLAHNIPDRFNHKNKNIRAAFWIVRLIRNTFAHNPFVPIWMTYPECEDEVYTVKNIIYLKTKGLNNNQVRRMDYGGPLALLRLLKFVKKIIAT